MELMRLPASASLDETPVSPVHPELNRYWLSYTMHALRRRVELNLPSHFGLARDDTCTQ